jgi:hypothetical protein
MHRLRNDCDGCTRVAPERSERIINAVLANIQNWEDRLSDIAEAAIPVTGNKTRALALARDMHMARLSLKRLAGHPDA